MNRTWSSAMASVDSDHLTTQTTSTTDSDNIEIHVPIAVIGSDTSVVATDYIFMKWIYMIVEMRYPLYIIAALLDVEASVLVLTAFKYTTVTSVVLLDSFAIPCTMVISYFVLNARYKMNHMIGTIFCLMGLLCNVVSDSYSEDSSDATGQYALFGDFLCLLAYFLYALSNVLQEYLVKYVNREEYLGMLGFWGTCFALIQCLATEYEELSNILPSADLSLILLIIAYVFILFLFYVNASIVLQSNDATYFNLSLLTSDVYALLITYFVFDSTVHWLYFLSFAFVVVGLLVYHSVPPPTPPSNSLLHTTGAHTTTARAVSRRGGDKGSVPIHYEEVRNVMFDDYAIEGAVAGGGDIERRATAC